MFEWFKEKTKIKEDAFQAGYDKGKAVTEKKWKIKISNMQTSANKIIGEKNKKIYNLNEKMQDIEKSLEEFTHLFGNMRGLALIIDEESETNLNIESNKFKRVKTLASSMLSLHKEYENRLPHTEKKIDKFKLAEFK